MSSIEVINEFMKSDDFLKKYDDYLKKKDDSLQGFLDGIDLNKKYYRMNINKNKRYVKENTKETSLIKEINSMINKITNVNYEVLKSKIIEKIEYDHVIPYIIQKLAESSIKHHIYIPYYVGILKEINNSKKKSIILRLCNKYHTEFFYENKSKTENTLYEQLCDVNKNIDNIIGFSLFISYLEKEDIIDGFIDKVIEQYIYNLACKEDAVLYKMLLSFENIANIHYQLIPQRYSQQLIEIKNTTQSSKIRFKIMDILKE